MTGKNTKDRHLCSFCGKSHDDVEVLIAAPGAYICDECVGKCNEVIEDYRKRRKTIEALDKISEPELIRLIMAEKQVFRWTLDFMLSGAFELVDPISTPPEPEFDSLLIALEVPRDELGLNADEAPGDIDMLIVPQNGQHNLYDKAMAIEVKVVRPTIENPSRNANSLGEKQSNKLANGGFPYVGLLHLIIPEPSPEYMLDEITVKTITAPGTPKPTSRKGKFDLFPARSADRQLGRLRRLRIPDCVGFNPVDLSIRAREEGSQTYLDIIGYGVQRHRKAKRNPNASHEVLVKVRTHMSNYAGRYMNIKWFD